jgi:hypothetical protein
VSLVFRHFLDSVEVQNRRSGARPTQDGAHTFSFIHMSHDRGMLPNSPWIVVRSVCIQGEHHHEWLFSVIHRFDDYGSDERKLFYYHHYLVSQDVHINLGSVSLYHNRLIEKYQWKTNTTTVRRRTLKPVFLYYFKDCNHRFPLSRNLL